MLVLASYLALAPFLAVFGAAASGPAQTLDVDDPEIVTIRDRRVSFILEGAASGSQVAAWLSTLGDDGKWPNNEVDYTTGCDARPASWPALKHWDRLLVMAAAWHGGGDAPAELANSTALLDGISRGMEFWFRNDFTEIDCLLNGGLLNCPCGTPGIWNTNWFGNTIAVPERVIETCLLVGPSTLGANHTAQCERIVSRTYNYQHKWTGANALDMAKIGIDGGLLVGNTTLVADGYARVHREVVVQNEVLADGIRADGSFGQHHGVIYNGNYGKDYTNNVLALEIPAGGTKYSSKMAAPSSQAALEVLLAADPWMIFYNAVTKVRHWDFSVLSRFISSPVADRQATSDIKLDVENIKRLGELWESDVLQSVYDNLVSSSDDANAGRINGNRMFYANDYMVQRGAGYVTTLRMFSSRTLNSECFNFQNPKGFHLSDGTLYTYLEGDEYEDIAAAWDWNLIPGITTDYGATELNCEMVPWRGVEAFVGGVSDGHIGAAAMRYTNPFTGSLSFQKAWFFLDDDIQIVMIPRADAHPSNPQQRTAPPSNFSDFTVRADADHPIFSVLDQKRHSGSVYVDGVPLERSANFTGARTLWHDRVGYTLDAPVLSVDIGPRTGDWADIGASTVGVVTVDLFSAWLPHPAGADAGGALAYRVFPATTRDEFQLKSTRTGRALRTVSNTDEVSAVYDAAHRTAAVVFWAAQGGSVVVKDADAQVTIKAAAAVALVWRMDEGAVTVADPAQSLAQVELTFETAETAWRPKGLGTGRKTVVVQLPSGGVAGQSVSVNLG